MINTEIEFILKWSQNCVLDEKVEREELAAGDNAAALPAVGAISRPKDLKFNITDCKLYVPVVTFQEKYENKLYEELKNGINIDFEWARYRSQVINQPATNNLKFLVDPILTMSDIISIAYIINLDNSKNTGTHWVVIFVKKDELIYFDSFGVEHIPEENKKLIGNKNIKSNIFRIRSYDSVMCGYFCILFIEFMLRNKTLTDFTNLFSSWNFKKNDKIIERYFQ